MNSLRISRKRDMPIGKRLKQRDEEKSLPRGAAMALFQKLRDHDGSLFTAGLARVVIAGLLTGIGTGARSARAAPSTEQLGFPVPAETRQRWHEAQKRFFRKVVDKFTEKDPADPQFGMIYELRDMTQDKWFQSQGLTRMALS